MLNQNKIIKIFCQYANITEDEVTKFSELITLNQYKVITMAKENLKDFKKLDYLCGILCFFDHCLLNSNNGKDISIGDLSVKSHSNNIISYAEKLKEDAFLMAKDDLKNDFLFLRI
ncbi:MAG: hypothetical protein RSE93_04275 [Oscillospiraceae bacterium]